MNPSPKAEKFFTWLWLILAVGLILSVRLHHLSMPLERDEGEYALAAADILHGEIPYKDFHNAKFPGTYLVCAVFISLFGDSASGLHLGLMLFSLGTCLLVFFTARRWMNSALSALAALSFALMSLSPTALALAGHATHFVGFFAVAATLLFVISQEKNKPHLWIITGCLAGLAILMKQQGSFVMIAFAAALLIGRLRKRDSTKRMLSSGLLILAGSIVPLLCTYLWIALSGGASAAKFWAIDFSRAYGAMLPLRTIPLVLPPSLVDVVMGSWVFWLAGMAGAIVILLPRRKSPTHGLPGLLLFCSLFSVIPGLFFRPHYFIVCFPFLALSLCAWLSEYKPEMRRRGLWLTIPVLLPAVITFHHIWWIASPQQASAMIYGSPIFSETTRVAEYAKEHTQPGSKLLIMGSEPQICFLAERSSATGFFYWYTHTDNHSMQAEVREIFEQEADQNAASTEMLILINHRSSLYHYPLKTGNSGSWINDYIRRNHFEQSWILIPEGEPFRRFSPFISPGEPHWQEIDGRMARDMKMLPEASWMAVFTRQRPQQF